MRLFNDYIFMDYIRIAEELKDKFIENPIDFVTESDLQFELVHIIKRELSIRNQIYCKVEKTELKNEKKIRFYKLEYFDMIQKKLHYKAKMNRVHCEVSITKGKRIDVVVFNQKLKNRINWVAQGSKRFHEDDIETAIELKFIKNKLNFPMKDGRINLNENKISVDIEDLGKLKKSKNFLLIFSNNNYLYHNPTDKETKKIMYIYRGKKAIDSLRKKGKENKVNILYVHPRDWFWIYKHQ